MAETELTGVFASDADGDKAYGPVVDSGGLQQGRAWHGYNDDGTYADGGVVPVDDSGNVLFTAANPGNVEMVAGGLAGLGLVGDSAYAGSGDAGVIGILKGVYARLATLVTGVLIAGTGIKVAASSTPVAAASGTDEAGLTAVAGRRLLGFSALETVGTDDGLIILHHGTQNSDPDLAYITVPAGEGMGDRAWGDDGIAVPNGVWIERQGSGTTKIVLYWKTVA